MGTMKVSCISFCSYQDADTTSLLIGMISLLLAHEQAGYYCNASGSDHAYHDNDLIRASHWHRVLDDRVPHSVQDDDTGISGQRVLCTMLVSLASTILILIPPSESVPDPGWACWQSDDVRGRASHWVNVSLDVHSVVVERDH